MKNQISTKNNPSYQQNCKMMKKNTLEADFSFLLKKLKKKSKPKNNLKNTLSSSTRRSTIDRYFPG
jgi:hypothetical protein